MVWTKKQEQILRREYPKGNLKELVKKLNKNIGIIQNRTTKLNIKREVKINLNSKNGMWKGDKVGLTALHEYIRRHKPKPLFCEKCKKNKPYDLANISGEYKRDIKDFKWLCRSCHMLEDNRIIKNFNKIPHNRKRKGDLFQCVNCGLFLPKSAFWKDNILKDKIKYKCINCYNLNRNEILKYHKKYYFKNRKKMLSQINFSYHKKRIIKNAIAHLRGYALIIKAKTGYSPLAVNKCIRELGILIK